MLAWARRLLTTTPRIASLDELFGIDVRALGVIRILIAVLVLFELGIRAASLSAHYGDSGVLPAAAALAYWDPQWVWSIHLLWNGATPFVAGLFAVHAFAALCLLVGYRTRIATVVTWFLYVSLINANLLIVSGDGFLRSILFVGMFLPWGRMYSWDSARLSAAPSKRVLSAWTAAFLLQLGFLYFFAVLYKDGAPWVSEGTAVYYALSNDLFATAFGKYLLHFPTLLEFLTFAIVGFQYAAPFLLFFPFCLGALRAIALGGLIVMHISFIATLHLGDFSCIMLAALLAFAPTSFWDRLERQIARIAPGFRLRAAEVTKSFAGLWARFGKAVSLVLGIAYIAYIFFWQSASVPRFQWPFPESLVVVAKVLRIDQQWRLFSPYPPVDDGWLLGIGMKSDGSEVDAMRGRGSVSYERPASVAAYYGNERWRKYFFNIVSTEYPPYQEYYADYLCRAWNDTHPASEQLDQVTLIYMLEKTPPPNSVPPEAIAQELATWDCQGKRAL